MRLTIKEQMRYDYENYMSPTSEFKMSHGFFDNKPNFMSFYSRNPFHVFHFITDLNDRKSIVYLEQDIYDVVAVEDLHDSSLSYNRFSFCNLSDETVICYSNDWNMVAHTRYIHKCRDIQECDNGANCTDSNAITIKATPIMMIDYLAYESKPRIVEFGDLAVDYLIDNFETLVISRNFLSNFTVGDTVNIIENVAEVSTYSISDEVRTKLKNGRFMSQLVAETYDDHFIQKYPITGDLREIYKYPTQICKYANLDLDLKYYSRVYTTITNKGKKYASLTSALLKLDKISPKGTFADGLFEIAGTVEFDFLVDNGLFNKSFNEILVIAHQLHLQDSYGMSEESMLTIMNRAHLFLYNQEYSDAFSNILTDEEYAQADTFFVEEEKFSYDYIKLRLALLKVTVNMMSHGCTINQIVDFITYIKHNLDKHLFLSQFLINSLTKEEIQTVSNIIISDLDTPVDLLMNAHDVGSIINKTS